MSEPELLTHMAFPMGAKMIVSERCRQVTKELFDDAHDDAQRAGQLLAAARCYLERVIYSGDARRPRDWPWEPHWWKPGDDIRDLTKAGALIAAEIDRLLRRRTQEVGAKLLAPDNIPPGS